MRRDIPVLMDALSQERRIARQVREMTRLYWELAQSAHQTLETLCRKAGSIPTWIFQFQTNNAHFAQASEGVLTETEHVSTELREVLGLLDQGGRHAG